MGYLGEVLTANEVKVFIAKYNNIRERICIKCFKPFESKGAHNRICPICKNKERYIVEKFNHRDILIHKSHEPGKRFHRDIYKAFENKIIEDLVIGYL